MRTNCWRVTTLALVVLSSSCSSNGNDEREPRKAEASANAPPQLQVKDLSALVDLVVAEDADLPKAEFDPAALVDALGPDPQKLFEWVRDRTWWAPYRGLLRGARGVMLDRVGSTLDRAVLLGDLMRRAGYTVRLAHAQLPEDRARELLGKVRSMPSQRRSPVAPRPAAAERQRALESISPGLGRALQERAADSRRYSDGGGALVRSQTDQLRTMVKDVVTRNGADDRAAIAALQDHWWLEREEGGQWLAMDVLLPEAAVGTALTRTSETFEWKAGAEGPSISASDWHNVRVRVVVERYQGGATSESTVLETVLRPAEVLEKPITLGHMSKPWPDVIPGSKVDPNALRNAALWVSEWVPYLRVGDELVAQSGFTESGDLKADPLGSKPQLGGGGLFGGMDEALGGGEDAEAYATAEWIDYEIRVPGQPNQQLRRPVFDLLGPARRSAAAAGFKVDTDALKLERFAALWSRTDILLQPCGFSWEYAAHLALAGAVANQGALRELAQERDDARVRSRAAALLLRVTGWGPLPSLAASRSGLSRQPGDWFVDRPDVLNYRLDLVVANPGQVVARETIDIASNAIGVRRGSGSNPFEVRLEQGVTDTVAEMLTLGSDLRMAANTASIFSRTAAAAGSSLVIGPRKADAVRDLEWPADASARLAEDVGAGFMAVAPRRPVLLDGDQRVGWWRIDPESGETIGVMDTGLHAVDERAEMEIEVQSIRTRLEHHAAEWEEWKSLALKHAERVAQHPNWSQRSPWIPEQLLEREFLKQRLAELLEALAGMP
jgi:hypothetical protein